MRQTSLNCVYDLAKNDPRIVFVGSDLGVGTLQKFKEEMPDRFFMEGVSEAHIIGMCAGMAMEGKIPYFNTITTFISRRAYEQVVLDLCLHNLNVRLIGSGGGLVYAPLGPTHLAIAAGAPVVGFFGPTEWWRNGSLNPEDICVERNDIDCRVDCHRRTCSNWICMDIPVESVFEAVQKRIRA